jgi:hypothetical protein
MSSWKAAGQRQRSGPRPFLLAMLLGVLPACTGASPEETCPQGQVRVDGVCQTSCTKEADCPAGVYAFLLFDPVERWRRSAKSCQMGAWAPRAQV